MESVATRPRGAGTEDDLRSAALLFDAELAGGRLAVDAVRDPEVLAFTRVRPVPGAGARVALDVRRKLGRLDYERAVAAPLRAARARALGEGAAAPPRFLVRVDEFPHYRAWDDPDRFGTAAFERFHEILAAHGVAYLLAVLPRVSRDPLSPARSESRPLADDERAMLTRLGGEGVAFAVHGLDHHTREASPRRHSELAGLDAAALEARLDAAEAELEGWPPPQAFVAPFNRFDGAQLALLTRRFAIVGGGPESIRQVGFHLTPQWRGGGMYVPAYAPFYGPAAGMLPAAEAMISGASGLWIPVVLHWGWEADDDGRALEALVSRIAAHAAPWTDLLAAGARSASVL